MRESMLCYVTVNSLGQQGRPFQMIPSKWYTQGQYNVIRMLIHERNLQVHVAIIYKSFYAKWSSNEPTMVWNDSETFKTFLFSSVWMGVIFCLYTFMLGDTYQLFLAPGKKRQNESRGVVTSRGRTKASLLGTAFRR